jgi:hypothetical protein
MMADGVVSLLIGWEDGAMKVRLPVMIKDTMHSEYLGVPLTENWFVEDEDFFLDGPVTRRVAVLDFDPATGELLPGVRFLPPNGGRKVARYDVPETIQGPEEVTDPKFIRVCALSAVLRTMKMFEAPDVLGRKLTWGFAAPQLLVVPRAGRWENAFYERESRSLQFFYFPPAGAPASPQEMVYTSLSNDIVAHETGHAILDGIAPDLYHAITPQALALHEAVADLVSVVMAFRSKTLSEAVLNKTRGTIRDSNAFSGIAEQYQLARNPFGDQHYLRNLLNDKPLDPAMRADPHRLSEVLSGALYSLIFRMHEDRKKQYSGGNPLKAFPASGKALAVATDHFKRLVFRALDYLPPGEVSFADYGRAIIAADQAIYPNRGAERELIAREFEKRKIVPTRNDLSVQTDFEEEAVSKLDLRTLVDSDWAAYEFANNNRDLLRIPQGIHFRVRARLATNKADRARSRKKGPDQSEGNNGPGECLFKVSWDHKEENKVAGLPTMRQITVGTTLAIDWETRRVRALLTSDYQSPQQQDNRDALLRQLLDEGVLRVGKRALGPDGNVPGSAVHAEVMDGLVRVRGMARTLHICGGSRS